MISTMIEIEKAIELLPTRELLEVAGWMNERTSLILASESMFQMLDGEEGSNAGNQWL
jgi:hypothetical protein